MPCEVRTDARNRQGRSHAILSGRHRRAVRPRHRPLDQPGNPAGDFPFALEQTIVATSPPTIGREPGGSEHRSWVVSPCLLAATAVPPPCGKPSDIHGRRVMLRPAILLFMAGSVACALAPHHAGADPRPEPAAGSAALAVLTALPGRCRWRPSRRCSSSPVQGSARSCRWSGWRSKTPCHPTRPVPPPRP